MNKLRHTEFGNPILRQKAHPLSKKEIQSAPVKQLIVDMQHTLTGKQLGVALAAPQVGQSIQLIVIAIRPVEHRLEVEPFDLVLCNPELIEARGRKSQVWEGCISGGEHNATLFAKVPRYKTVVVRYIDATGKSCTTEFIGLKAQIMQHEIDHLNGILFVDRVKDSTTYTTYKEYLKLHKSSK